MKLKQRPDDFRVEERADLTPDAGAPFALYQLEKRNLGTPEAVQHICRRWQIDGRRVSYGGLKDRHAETQQYLTIRHGPRRGMQQTQFSLRYLGQVPAPFTPEQIRGNRFQIAIRALGLRTRARAEQALAEVQADGVANYFDDQRFSSVSRGRDFIARRLIAGDFEAALRLALVEPYEFDRAAQKEAKRVLRERWGDWSAIKERLGKGDGRRVVAYLADHPADFRGAFAGLRADLKSLYLAAYQSHLWNRILARWIEEHTAREQRVVIRSRLGPLVMPRGLDSEQRRLLANTTLPLPSARLHLAADEPLRPLIDFVLAKEGLELSQIKLKHLREPFFAKGDRAVMVDPENLRARWEADDLNPGREKLILGFDLPRGSYATMLVKRITLREGVAE